MLRCSLEHFTVDIRTMITVGNRTDNVIFEEVEHILLPNEWNSRTLQVAALLVSFLIISLNGTIVKIILKQERKTFLDWMIVIDSHLCIGATLPLVIFASNASLNEVVCLIKIGMMFFISIINRILAVIIVIYRAIYVLKPHLVETKTKRRVFTAILLGSISLISVCSTLGMAIYREDFKMFKGRYEYLLKVLLSIKVMLIVCMQEEHEFYYNLEDFYSPTSSDHTATETGQWSLSIFHPFHATIIVCFFSGTILVPILYGRIYR